VRILLVDDDPGVLVSLSEALRDRHEVTCCGDGGTALEWLREPGFEIVVTDLKMPPPDGLQVLEAAQALDPPVPVIVLTAVDSARAAVNALRLGARDFLVKPAVREDIVRAIASIEDRLPVHAVAATAARESPACDYGLIGSSAPIQLVRRLIPALAKSRETVLIVGETGTGKELLARALHFHGPRRDGPFVAHNMAATPSELAETIFFGHVRGAFSGATTDHLGLFEQADGGTLFLDEVDSFPPSLQAKLLRVLEGGCVQRVGSGVSRAFDVRVVAASATELCAQVEAGGFRADLYYRLKQLEVALPPLRERRGDIPMLVAHFLEELATESGTTLRLEPAAMDRVLGHTWPGNVRELRNVVRGAAVMAGAGPIRPEHLPATLRSSAKISGAGGSGSLHSLEVQHILETLESVHGNQSRAARILGIDRGTLARKLSAAKREEAGPS
jgi:DNA-binding NtrC family response regulator